MTYYSSPAAYCLCCLFAGERFDIERGRQLLLNRRKFSSTRLLKAKARSLRLLRFEIRLKTASIDIEVILGCFYITLLMATALLLELSALFTHNRSKATNHRGFHFHPRLDAWRCPKGEYLCRVNDSHRPQTLKYRASAHICNKCELKRVCTDSDDGRTISISLDPWIQTEVGKFHRIFSILLLGLAALTCVAVWTRHHNSMENVCLFCTLCLIGTTMYFFLRGVLSARPSVILTERRPVGRIRR